jgi:hypothetical protein
MIRILSVAAAALAIAGAAQAQSITVRLAGKDANTIHRDIVRAAYQVCSDEVGATPLAHLVVPGCVHETVAKAEAQLGKATVASAATQGHDAAASVAAR